MIKVLREKNDTARFSPSCLFTLLFSAVLLLGGAVAFFTIASTNADIMLRGIYPLVETMLITSEAKEKAVFSNSYMRMCHELKDNPGALTNKSLFVFRKIIGDHKISEEEIEKFRESLDE